MMTTHLNEYNPCKVKINFDIFPYDKHLESQDLVRVNYREGGLYVIYSPEDAQRPRAVYHIQPNFEVIN